MVREFRKPDVKAPRCRSKATRIVNTTFLKALFEKYPELKGMKPKEIRDVLSTLHNRMWDHVVNNRDGVELPEQLGYVFVGTCNSPKKFNVDYGNSIKSDYSLRHRNFESDSYLAKIFYTNFASKYNFKYRNLWMFEATRNFKRTVAKVYPEKWKIYVQVENGRNISKYLKRTRKRDYFKKLSSLPVAEDYNEFELD